MTERTVTIKFIGQDQGLANTSGKAKDNLTGLEQASDRARDSQGRFIQTTREFDGVLGKASLTADQVRDSLLGIAATTGIAGGAIASLFVGGTREFIEFDNALKQSSVVAGATAEETELLRMEVERLGIATSKAPAEVAATSVALSRAGFAAEETSAALEGIVRASEATGASLEVTGDIAAKTLRAFSLEASESNRVADVLVATANNTNTSITSLGESLAYASSQASAANQPLEDTLIAIGLLGDAGIQGSAAGTGLAEALRRLQLTSAANVSEFSDLARGSRKAVEAFQQIQGEVRDADGQLKSILDILPIIQDSFANLGQEDQDLIANALFGVQGGRTIQTLLNVTGDRLTLVTDEIRNSGGAAQEAGEQMLQGLGGALDLIGGSIGATTAKFGELVAIGLEPLVRAGTAVLNTFLALPGPLQAAVVGVIGFTGVLAAAIAALTAFEALQLKQSIANALIVGQTKLYTVALQANTIAIAASNIANTIFNAQLTKQSVLQAANAIAARASATAQQLYAIATGQASAATLALAGRMAVLAAQAALVAGAVFAVAQVFKRSEGAQFAADLDQAVDGLLKTRRESEESEGAIADLGDRFSDFFANIQDVGPVEALRIALVDLQSAIFGTADASDRFGAGFGAITAQQRGAQIAQLELANTTNRLGGSIQSTIDVFGQYGQAINGLEARLNPAQLAAFTAAASEQAQVLQQEIDVLEAQLGQSEELDQQLQAEIDTRQNLIESIKSKIAAQNGDSSAVDAAVNSSRELGDVLDELKGKYSDLQGQLDLNAAESLAAIAEQQAAGLLTEAEAQQRAAATQQNSLETSLANNRALLAELTEQRLQRRVSGGSDEDLETLDREILSLQTEIANGRRSLAESNIKTAEDETKAIEAEAKKQTEALNEAAEAAIAIATLAETERQTELEALRRDGLIREEEYQAELAQANLDRIQSELAAERDRVEALTASGAGEDEIRKAKQRTAQLALDLIKAERDAQERLIEVQVAAINRRLQEQENASRRAQLSIQEEQRAIEAVNETLNRQQQLLQARANLQGAITDAIASEFSIAARLTEDEEERGLLSERAALTRVQQLERSQQIELQIFDLKQRQLEIQNRIAQAQLDADVAANQAEQARAAAALEELEARRAGGGDVSDGEIEAARLNLQAAQQQGNAFELQRTALAGQAQLLAEQRALERDALQTRQNTARNEARADAIGAIADDQTRNRLAAQERDRILGSNPNLNNEGLRRDVLGRDRGGVGLEQLRRQSLQNFQAAQLIPQQSLVQPLANVPQFTPQTSGRLESVLGKLEETLGRSRREVIINNDNTANIQVAAGEAVQQDLEDQFFGAIASAASEAERQLRN